MLRSSAHCWSAMAMATLVASLPAAEPKISFTRQIKPILANKCFVCHGPDEKERKAELRLDMRDEAVPSVRLDQYDRTVKLGLARAYDATVLLLRAQRSESIADSAALIREAGIQSSSSIRLLEEAADELRMLLPVTAL